MERMSGLVFGCKGRAKPSLTFGWRDFVRKGTFILPFLGRVLARLRLGLGSDFVEVGWEVVMVLYADEVEG